MMYDIYFDPGFAKWRIRMVYPMLVFFSTTREVNRADGQNGDTPSVMLFDTYASAEKYTEDTGLKRAYTMRYPKRVPSMTEVLNGAENYAHQNDRQYSNGGAIR